VVKVGTRVYNLATIDHEREQVPRMWVQVPPNLWRRFLTDGHYHAPLVMSVAIRKNAGAGPHKIHVRDIARGTQPNSEGGVGSTENRYDFQFFHIFGNTSLWAEQKIVPPPVQAGEGVWMLNWCDSHCYRGCCELTVRERTSDSCRTVCKRAGLTSSPIFSAPHQARCWRTGQHVSRGYGHRRHDRRSSPTWGKSPKPLSVLFSTESLSE